MTRVGPERWIPAAALLLVAVVYLPSLGGDWVWDDVYQLRDNPAITRPTALATRDVWGPTGFADPRNAPVYRPLAMLSHAPGQALWPGPAVERALSLLLHLLAVTGAAALAVALGAPQPAAWLGAALFGVHPAASEAVAWPSARADLLGTVLLLAAWLALLRRRDVAAGLLAALTPLCKESFLLAPLTLVLLGWGLERRVWLAAGVAAAGSAASLALRWVLGIELPGGAAPLPPAELLAAVAALAQRGLRLLVDPTAPEALVPAQGMPVLGVAVLGAGALALWAARGRPRQALALAPLVLLVPCVPAVAGNGRVADRYFYAGLAAVGVLAALAFGARPPAPRRWAVALLLPVLLAPLAAWRAWAWTSNERLFSASVARRPHDPEALFHLAHARHVGAGGCAAALPLYRRAADGSARAANNLQACWLEAGRLEQAARLGPELAARDPANPTPALNTARALSQLGDQDAAEHWAREGIRRAPERATGWVLLGNVLGLQARFADARDAFERALALAPGLPDAVRGHELALRRMREQARRVDPAAAAG